MFVHYDFMKKGFQGSSLESSLEVFQLRMCDVCVTGDQKNSVGALN